jgi:hypothetical protein
MERFRCSSAMDSGARLGKNHWVVTKVVRKAAQKRAK